MVSVERCDRIYTIDENYTANFSSKTPVFASIYSDRGPWSLCRIASSFAFASPPQQEKTFKEFLLRKASCTTRRMRNGHHRSHPVKHGAHALLLSFFSRLRALEDSQNCEKHGETWRNTWDMSFPSILVVD